MISFPAIKKALSTVSYPAIFLLIMLLASCATTGKDFQAAKQGDSIQGYQTFLAEHPNSKHTEWVNDRISELKAERAKKLKAERAKEIETAKSSGDIRKLLELGPLWSDIGEDVKKNGTPLSQSESHSLRSAIIKGISKSIQQITGGGEMSMRGGNTTIFEKLWFYRDRDFIFFPEGMINGKEYKNMCYYDGLFYQLPEKDRP